jgi:hypothetical protein
MRTSRRKKKSGKVLFIYYHVGCMVWGKSSYLGLVCKSHSSKAPFISLDFEKL